MSDIFNEIDEEIRREQLHKLWRRFGPLLILLAVLIVIGVAGWRYWEHKTSKDAAAAGERYAAALALAQDGKTAEAEAALKAISADGPQGYRMLARFRAATELAKTDPAGALAGFESISQDSSVSALLRDMARIRAAFLLVDSGSQADVASRVEVLAAPGNAWRHAARELMALAAWKAGDLAETRRWAQELIGDIEAPAGSRTRGQLLLDLASGADQAGTPEPPAAADDPSVATDPSASPEVPATALPDAEVPASPEDPAAPEEPVAPESDAPAPEQPAEPAQ
jgi:hypothetical protein